jgi:hypothetical protein
MIIIYNNYSELSAFGTVSRGLGKQLEGLC